MATWDCSFIFCFGDYVRLNVKCIVHSFLTRNIIRWKLMPKYWEFAVKSIEQRMLPIDNGDGNDESENPDVTMELAVHVHRSKLWKNMSENIYERWTFPHDLPPTTSAGREEMFNVRNCFLTMSWMLACFWMILESKSVVVKNGCVSRKLFDFINKQYNFSPFFSHVHLRGQITSSVSLWILKVGNITHFILNHLSSCWLHPKCLTLLRNNRFLHPFIVLHPHCIRGNQSSVVVI